MGVVTRGDVLLATHALHHPGMEDLAAVSTTLLGEGNTLGLPLQMGEEAGRDPTRALQTGPRFITMDRGAVAKLQSGIIRPHTLGVPAKAQAAVGHVLPHTEKAGAPLEVQGVGTTTAHRITPKINLSLSRSCRFVCCRPAEFIL